LLVRRRSAAGHSDRHQEILARGETLVKEGDAKAPFRLARVAIGPSLAAWSRARLLGLRASYISAQLGGWRYGTRTAATPDACRCEAC